VPKAENGPSGARCFSRCLQLCQSLLKSLIDCCRFFLNLFLKLGAVESIINTIDMTVS
jgi:hypothetical protein